MTGMWGLGQVLLQPLGTGGPSSGPSPGKPPTPHIKDVSFIFAIDWYNLMYFDLLLIDTSPPHLISRTLVSILQQIWLILYINVLWLLKMDTYSNLYLLEIFESSLKLHFHSRWNPWIDLEVYRTSSQILILPWAKNFSLSYN